MLMRLKSDSKLHADELVPRYPCPPSFMKKKKKKWLNSVGAGGGGIRAVVENKRCKLIWKSSRAEG